MMKYGRKPILTEHTPEDMLDIGIMATVVNTTMGQHLKNKIQIDYLMEYRGGNQTVLSKTKAVRNEINNKVVLNHAQMITRNIIGYFLGNPIQYIQAGDTDKKDDIDLLNRYVAYEDKYAVDKEIGEYQSVCGTAYRIIFSDGKYGDEVPFEDRSLDPALTYVVYENSIAEKPVLGVTYHDILSEDNEVIGKHIYAYTEYGLYDIKTDTSLFVDDSSTIDFTPYNVGGIPIIEYPNNIWRVGDWELCIGLMDAINALHSGRLDDIDQTVQSLLVFMNADIDADMYDQMRELGVVMLKNNSGNPSSVESIETSLDQSGMNMFADELESMLYALVGIPNRNDRAGGGGDTGQAVELRDGWADLEVIARNKEMVFKRAEKQSLRIMLNILNSKHKTKLTLMDIDIKFTRNKNNNLLVKTQAYQTLIGTKTLSPADCLTIVDLVSDVNEYISRGKSFWGSSFAGLEEANMKVEASAVNLENMKNPPVTEGGDGNTPPAKDPKAKKE